MKYRSLNEIFKAACNIGNQWIIRNKRRVGATTSMLDLDDLSSTELFAYVDCPETISNLMRTCKRAKQLGSDSMVQALWLLRHRAGKAFFLAAREREDVFLHVLTLIFTSRQEQKHLIFERDETGRKALHWACEAGFPRAVQILLRVPGVIASEVDTFGYTPLHLAAQQDNLEVLEVLLHQYDPRANELNEKYTPLHLAAAAGNVRATDFLLERFGVNTVTITAEATEWLGDTPLHVAAMRGHANVVERILMKVPLDVINRIAHGKSTPLHYAAEYARVDAIQQLLKVPSMEELICTRNEDGWSPLVFAVEGIAGDFWRVRDTPDEYERVLQLFMNRPWVVQEGEELLRDRELTVHGQATTS